MNTFQEKPGFLRANFSLSQGGFIVYSNTYYPGWKATLNGSKIPVYMADSYVKGVVVDKPGEYQLEMKYQPKSFYVGLILTSLSTLGYFLLLIKPTKREIV